MEQRALVAAVAAKTDYAKWEINTIIEPLLTVVLEVLQNGEEVHLKNFGQFSLKYHKKKEVLHPKTRQRIQIPEKVSIIFTQTRMFKPTDETIEKLREQAMK